MGFLSTSTTSPLYYFDYLSLSYIRKLLRSSLFWTYEVARWLPRLDIHKRIMPTANPYRFLSPLDLALEQPEESRTANAALIVRAAEPWSPHNHELFPLETRQFAVSLHTIGYHLDYHRGFRGFGELWVNRVLPEILDRQSRRPLRVPDVLSMRRTELARELALRGFKDYECTPFMTAEELREDGLDDPSQKVLMVGELLKEIGAIEDEDE